MGRTGAPSTASHNETPAPLLSFDPEGGATGRRAVVVIQGCMATFQILRDPARTGSDPWSSHNKTPVLLLPFGPINLLGKHIDGSDGNHRPMRIQCGSGPSRLASRAQNAGWQYSFETPSAHLSTQLCRRGAGAGTAEVPPQRARGEFSQFTRDSAAGQGAGWGRPEMGSGKVA